MQEHREANPEQAGLWNGAAGQAWVDMQRVLDHMLAPFNPLLIDQAIGTDVHRVLDVGCGAVSTTFAAARRLAEGGQCLGVDISAPLIAVARTRVLEEGFDRARFVHSDAQTHEFEWNSFHAVISRFGVMFFADPVTAFINMRSAARSDAVLAFTSWRSPAENLFMTAATRAAAPFLPSLPTPDPNGPGQFGLADPGRIQTILEASGWKSIDIRPVNVPVRAAEQDVLTYGTRLGPVGLALREADEATRSRTIAAVHAAFGPFISDGVARFDAACWLVTARA